MSKRYLIVGGVAGGATAATRLRRLDEAAEIIIYEQGPHVSYSNCALPFYLSGTVASADQLVMMTPQAFKTRYNIEAKVNHRVTSIDPVARTVQVHDLVNDQVAKVAYDKLILSPGSQVVVPSSLKGNDQDHVFVMKTVPDVDQLKTYIDRYAVEDIVVIGAGFIGMETAENLRLAGKNVTIVEARQQILPIFDEDMVQTLHKEVDDQGVQLLLNESVEEILVDSVRLASGRTLPAGAVVLALGVQPLTELAISANLAIGATKGIQVNHNYQTSDPDIYAIGDAIEVTDKISRQGRLLAMAGNAQRQARAVADHICGRPVRQKGVIGSSILRVFDLNAAATGLNETDLQAAGIPYDFVYGLAMDKVGLVATPYPIFLKLLFHAQTGEILGAQAIGKGNIDKRIDVIATLISMNGSLDDLKDLELAYSPLYGTAKDAVNQAAMVGLNVLDGLVKQTPVTQVRQLVENGACIIDVREQGEWDAGHLKGAIHIPMSEFRQRLDEFPKDRPIYLHCRSSQRSYIVARALMQQGYEEVYNIQGSFLGICLYEYFHDKSLGREPIVTAYNFN